MTNNAFSKLVAVSLAGIVIIFILLWGIEDINRYNRYASINMGHGYQMNGVQMWPQNNMMGYSNRYGMNGYMQGMPNQGNWMIGGMYGNIQGSMNGNMQGSMGMS